MEFKAIKALTHSDFEAVDVLIKTSLHSKASIINDLGHYIVQSGGKRLRPLVLLLIARACGYQGSNHIPLAAVIELIHTATLLHDDVVDNAEQRRGQQTANHRWGNEAAVLVGDFLYSKAFQIIVHIETENLSRILHIVADATNVMAEGEALQLLGKYNAETTEGAYLNIIRTKTAKLFESAAALGAILSGVSEELITAMANYGMHLGTAFQLIDDVLDYQISQNDTGKTPGNDLQEGKVTLPLIYLLQQGTPSEVNLIREAIQTGGKTHFATIQKLIASSNAITYTMNAASAEIDRAQQALSVLPASPFKDGAHALAQFALERRH